MQVGETSSAGAEGATAPETLRQKDRLPRKHSGKWSPLGSHRRCKPQPI